MLEGTSLDRMAVEIEDRIALDEPCSCQTVVVVVEEAFVGSDDVCLEYSEENVDENEEVMVKEVVAANLVKQVDDEILLVYHEKEGEHHDRLLVHEISIGFDGVEQNPVQVARTMRFRPRLVSVHEQRRVEHHSRRLVELNSLHERSFVAMDRNLPWVQDFPSSFQVFSLAMEVDCHPVQDAHWPSFSVFVKTPS